MAEGRFINTRRLSDSKKFCALSDPVHQLAYVLILGTVDAEGRFMADPITLKGQLFTRLDWPLAAVKEALADLCRVGLVELYVVDGEDYGRIVDFHKHNTIKRGRKGNPDPNVPTYEAASKLPAPPEKREVDTGNGRALIATQSDSENLPDSSEQHRAASFLIDVDVDGDVDRDEDEDQHHHPPVALDVGPPPASAGGDEHPVPIGNPPDTLTTQERFEADDALRRSTRPNQEFWATELRRLHLQTSRQFDRLQSVYRWKPGEQYLAVAEKLVHLVGEYGDRAVAGALEAVVLMGKDTVKSPIGYAEAVLKRAKADNQGDLASIDFDAVSKSLFGEVN